MAKKEKKEKKGKKSSEGSKGSALLVVMMVLASLVMIVFMQMTYVLFVVGVLPSFVAYYVDRTPSRSLFHTVMPCNLSGVLPFMVELMATGNETSTMQMMIGDFSVLLIMYVSAGMGWVLVYVMPLLAGLIINMLNQRQISQIKGSQKRLVQEWGNEVTRNESGL